LLSLTHTLVSAKTNGTFIIHLKMKIQGPVKRTLDFF